MCISLVTSSYYTEAGKIITNKQKHIVYTSYFGTWKEPFLFTEWSLCDLPTVRTLCSEIIDCVGNGKGWSSLRSLWDMISLES